MIGTFNQQIQFSRKIGGYRRIFEGQVKLIEGGFKANLVDLPSAGNVLPAGTPLYCDEVNRTVVPLITYKVLAVDADASTIKVEKLFSGTRAKVGGYLVVLPNADLSATGTAMQISEIDNSNEGFDILTVDKVAVEGTAIVAEGDIIADATSAGKLKVSQVNALAPYDTCLDPEAYACDIDGAYACFDRSVLVRRMPPVNDAIWASLKANDCYFRRSNRK